MGPRKGADLKRAGLATVEDLLYRLPFRYEDRSRMQPIASLRPGNKAAVLGDIKSAEDVGRARAETGCETVMVGRAAIDYPWIFREAKALLAGERIVPPTEEERRAVYRAIVERSAEARGERNGVASAKRHVGVLEPALRQRVQRALLLGESLDVLSQPACSAP